MKVYSQYQEFLPIIKKARLFQNIPEEHFTDVLSYLNYSIRTYEKDELIQRLGEMLKESGIVLEGTVEGSFVSQAYNKINMNHFHAGSSFGEALACTNTSYSPIQLRALTDCTILFLELKQVFTKAPSDCQYQLQLSQNLIQILASQNVFSNLKLRIANQKSLRDKMIMYLHSLVPDQNGYLHVPFNQTALAEFLGVNRSALSRELGKMQDEGILYIDGRRMKLLVSSEFEN